METTRMRAGLAASGVHAALAARLRGADLALAVTSFRAANAGVQIHEIGQGGLFSADGLRAATKPRNFAVFPNIVVFHLPATLPLDAPTLCTQARERGVLVNAFGPRTVRAVTHLDLDRTQCLRAADVLVGLLAG